jgi:hypothetical protein
MEVAHPGEEYLANLLSAENYENHVMPFKTLHGI